MIEEIVISIVTITIALIMTKVVTKEKRRIIMNEKCITIHKIKDKYAYAIVSYKDQLEIVTNEDQIKLLVKRASYNGN